MPVFSEKDIQAKIEKGRIVLVNSEKVYDVTEFAERHPGGKEYLHQNKGEDVTALMQKQTPHQHSSAAYSILNKYCIGTYSRKHDDLVDWSKPIFWQVPHIGERYFEWVHQPVDKPIRLFHSDFCEFFSVCKWWIVPLFWTPVMFILLWLSYTKLAETPAVWPSPEYGFTITPHHMPVVFALGVLFWTFDEYAIHRWLFHLRPPHQYPFLILMHFILHGQHHKSPMDKGRLVFPTVPACLLAIVFYSLYASIFGTSIALCLFAGTIAGYMAYDLVHYYLHHGVAYGTYFKNLKKYHVKHHFKNQQLVLKAATIYLLPQLADQESSNLN
ncbi:hypothetical protein KUTeg_018844 [Tegillarca granosa]|uniref:Fatty acid 2-hydroxylase n=1 Tax=Tegillarca granosa TaxID=220873 RepID=A0ABQ9EAT4_TEGGR|nr:hypothetical protein KUTeg_018844 [Tegillarca granosa]